MIDSEEVDALAHRYGKPIHRTVNLQADAYMYAQRARPVSDRRAEVVFAIQEPGEKIWLHAKAHYPSHLFRLPSGGIEWEESVEDALLREVHDETMLPVHVEKFLGMVTYRFHRNGTTVEFASYIFHLRTVDGRSPVPLEEEITDFRAVLPSQLPQASRNLRNLIGNRRCWGQWRAIAHDLVYERLGG